MKRIILFSAALLAGCASQTMQGYVGKDITEVIMDYGQPTSIIDLPDGNKAFQWNDSATTSTSRMQADYSANSSKGKSSLNSEYASTYTQANSSGGGLSDCLYTFIAEKGELEKSWVIKSFRKPSLLCE